MIKTLWSRLEALLAKLISVKGLILGLATYLCAIGKISGMEWFLAAGAIAGTRAYEKKIAKAGG
jgi:hypothetical protein